MAVELARHLIASEAVPRWVVDAALLRHVKQGDPFLFALTQAHPEYRDGVERELLRLTGPVVSVPPAAQWLQRMPSGLAVRLLAFPVGVTASTGEVDVLAADPLDSQIPAEFSFHLGRPVRVLRGPLAEVVATLKQQAEHWFQPETVRQNLGSMNEPAHSRVGDSLPPIPLVRRPPVGSLPAPGTLRGVAPQALAAAQPLMPAPNSSLRRDELEPVLAALGQADSAEQVATHLAAGMSQVCDEAIVFALRADGMSSRVRLNHAGLPERFLDLELKRDVDCSLLRAVQTGQYLGPPTSEDLLLLVGQPSEVLATRVSVSGRPALVFVAGGFRDSFRASQTADRLARAAAEALGRVVLARKK